MFPDLFFDGSYTNLPVLTKVVVERKHYKNDEITVVWEPGKCIHSAICFNGLIEVFNPRRRPWINMAGASTEKIMAQVRKCPSGALSFFANDAKPEAPAPGTQQTLETEVEVRPNGPLLIYGTLRVKDSHGNETVKSQTTAFCRCGGSNNKPYCDGTHTRIGFNDEQ